MNDLFLIQLFGGSLDEMRGVVGITTIDDNCNENVPL